MPQAGFGLATTLDPDDDEAWIAAISELIDEPQALEEQERQIEARFKRRSWDDAGAEFIEQVLSTGNDTHAHPAGRSKSQST